MYLPNMNKYERIVFWSTGLNEFHQKHSERETANISTDAFSFQGKLLLNRQRSRDLGSSEKRGKRNGSCKNDYGTNLDDSFMGRKKKNRF